MYRKKSRTPLGCPEINIPPERPKVNIFADFETFLFTDGYPIWEHKDEENFSNVLATNCEVVPWLLAANMPAIRSHFRGRERVVDAEDYRLYFSAEYPHHTFFVRLKSYWEAGCVPVIWFHNASYDLTSCIETSFKEIDPDLKIYFTTKENKNFLTGFMESPLYGFKAKFGDTLLYRRISIEAIGKMFGSEKGEIPYTMMDLYIENNIVHYTDWYTGKQESIHLLKCAEYIKQDVHLLQRYHAQLVEETELITIAVNGTSSSRVRTTTQGVHARSLLDLWMIKQNNGKFESVFKFPVSNSEGKIMQRSLTGGFTTLNKNCFTYKCAETHEITSYDCNSMYPFIMTLGLPCGRLLNERPKGRHVEWVCITCSNVKWKGLMSCLRTAGIPANKQGFGDETNDMSIYVPREFLNFIRENSTGEFVEHYTRFQRVTGVAGSFVNYIYDLRKTLRNEHRTLEAQCEKGDCTPEEHEEMRQRIEQLRIQENGVKTTINSLYGKLCEKIYVSQTVYVDGKFREVLDDDPQYLCTLTGAYIAIMGRLILYNKIKKVLEMGFDFLYADTDSVKFAYPIAEKHRIEAIFGHNTGELGQWKNEGTWQEFWSPGKKKKYAMINLNNPKESKITLSGISENPFIIALKNGLLEDREKTVEDIRYIFSPTSNVLFKNAKNNTVRTNKYDQIVIYPVNVSTNVDLKKPTAEVYMEDGKYVLKKYGCTGKSA